jgi:hypothetical protein
VAGDGACSDEAGSDSVIDDGEDSDCVVGDGACSDEAGGDGKGCDSVIDDGEMVMGKTLTVWLVTGRAVTRQTVAV